LLHGIFHVHVQIVLHLSHAKCYSRKCEFKPKQICQCEPLIIYLIN
jgi:hypothetical protein